MSRTRILILVMTVAFAVTAAAGFVPTVADALNPIGIDAPLPSDGCAPCMPPALGRVEFAADFIQ